MKKLIPIVTLLALVAFLGCSDDDDGGGGTGPTPIARVEVRTDLTAPAMSSVDEAVWDAVTSTALDLSNANTPPVNAPKPTLLSDSVYVQAIKASGKLFLRLEWDDDDFSIKRDLWYLNNVATFSFGHYTEVYEEDQVFIMFEMADGGSWDTWNWRSLTTGQSKVAEGMTYADSALTVDDDNGVYTLAWENYNGVDNSRPIWVHQDKWDFTDDIMFIDDTLPVIATAGETDWYVGMTVPGWILLDTVLPAAMKSQSRWDISAIYDYDSAAGHYKLVMSRPLTGGSDDLDMSNLTEVKVRIGVLNDKPIYTQGSSNVFTEDFMMDF